MLKCVLVTAQPHSSTATVAPEYLGINHLGYFSPDVTRTVPCVPCSVPCSPGSRAAMAGRVGSPGLEQDHSPPVTATVSPEASPVPSSCPCLLSPPGPPPGSLSMSPTQPCVPCPQCPHQSHIPYPFTRSYPRSLSLISCPGPPSPGALSRVPVPSPVSLFCVLVPLTCCPVSHSHVPFPFPCPSHPVPFPFPFPARSGPIPVPGPAPVSTATAEDAGRTHHARGRGGERGSPPAAGTVVAPGRSRCPLINGIIPLKYGIVPSEIWNYSQ